VVSNPVRIIIGVVNHAYPVNQNPDTGKWRPANFSIETDTDTDEVYIKQFPTSHWDSEQGTFVTPEPITMPAWYDGLISAYGATMQGLEGLTVQIKGEAKFNKQRGTIEYEVVGQGFTVLDEAAPTPKENISGPTGEGASTPPPEQPRTYSLDERIAWNSAINNAVNAHTVTPIEIEWDVWLGNVDRLANKIYHVIRRGPVEIEEEAVEPEATTLDSF